MPSDQKLSFQRATPTRTEAAARNNQIVLLRINDESTPVINEINHNTLV